MSAWIKYLEARKNLIIEEFNEGKTIPEIIQQTRLDNKLVAKILDAHRDQLVVPTDEILSTLQEY